MSLFSIRHVQSALLSFLPVFPLPLLPLPPFSLSSTKTEWSQIGKVSPARMYLYLFFSFALLFSRFSPNSCYEGRARLPRATRLACLSATATVVSFSVLLRSASKPFLPNSQGRVDNGKASAHREQGKCQWGAWVADCWVYFLGKRTITSWANWSQPIHLAGWREESVKEKNAFPVFLQILPTRTTGSCTTTYVQRTKEEYGIPWPREKGRVRKRRRGEATAAVGLITSPFLLFPPAAVSPSLYRAILTSPGGYGEGLLRAPAMAERDRNRPRAVAAASAFLALSEP